MGTHMCATKVRAKARAAPSPPRGSLTQEIDRTDRAILRSLQRDASLSNVALAAKVNLSALALIRTDPPLLSKIDPASAAQ